MNINKNTYLSLFIATSIGLTWCASASEKTNTAVWEVLNNTNATEEQQKTQPTPEIKKEPVISTDWNSLLSDEEVEMFSKLTSKELFDNIFGIYTDDYNYSWSINHKFVKIWDVNSLIFFVDSTKFYNYSEDLNAPANRIFYPVPTVLWKKFSDFTIDEEYKDFKNNVIIVYLWRVDPETNKKYTIEDYKDTIRHELSHVVFQKYNSYSYLEWKEYDLINIQDEIFAYVYFYDWFDIDKYIKYIINDWWYNEWWLVSKDEIKEMVKKVYYYDKSSWSRKIRKEFKEYPYMTEFVKKLNELPIDEITKWINLNTRD